MRKLSIRSVSSMFFVLTLCSWIEARAGYNSTSMVGDRSAAANRLTCTNWQPTGTVVNVTTSTNLQTAINSAAAGSILVLASGNYNITSTLTLKSGVSITCASGAHLQANNHGAMISGYNVSNLSIYGCDFDGTSLLDSYATAIVIMSSNNVNVMDNNFHNFSSSLSQGYVVVYNSGNLAITGNTNTGNTGSEFEPISMIYNDGNSYGHIFVTDNNFSGWTRMGIEATLSTGANYDIHFDRNALVVPVGGTGISVVGGATAGITTGSVAGNTISGTGGVGMEIGLTNMAMRDNSLSGVHWGILISSSPGTSIFNNTFSSISTSQIYGQDGGWVNDYWIGTNTINGTAVSGWSTYPNVISQPFFYEQSSAFCPMH